MYDGHGHIHKCWFNPILMELEHSSAIIRVDMVTPYSLNKSDISYLKTSRADIPIHSRALLAAIL